MDFIKNLHISDIASDKAKSHGDDTTPAPPPPTAIGAVHPQTDIKHGSSSSSAAASFILDKIGDALNSHVEQKGAPAVPAAPAPIPVPAPVQAAHKEENILHKLGDVLASSKTHTAPVLVPAPAPVPVAAPHKEENLLAKLGDALSGKQQTATATPAPIPVAPAAHKDENILHKLGDALSGRKTPPPPPPPTAAPIHPSNSLVDKLTDKLTEAVTGKKVDQPPPPPPPPAHQNIVDKLSDKLTEAVTGKNPNAPPPKPQSFVEQLSEVVLKKDDKVAEKPHGLADKVNSALGGGSKAEAEEGRLDKAIDMFQEHILKQGPQNNESAIEQAKDKEIANMIRAAVGKEKK